MASIAIEIQDPCHIDMADIGEQHKRE
jgi:hypothetical protein